MTSTIIAPNTPTWQGLLDTDRWLVLDWTQRPRIALQPSVSLAVPDTSWRHTQPVPQRLVSDMMREAKREMRVRVWRDTGPLVGMALAGAGVAAYVGPPVSLAFVGSAAVWLLGLVVAARHVAGRARGRGVVGTAEGNAAYFADPEAHAVGGVLGFSIGAGLGLVAMVLALVAKP